MGILDAFKKVGGASKSLIEKASQEIRYRQKVKEIKIEILMRIQTIFFSLLR